MQSERLDLYLTRKNLVCHEQLTNFLTKRHQPFEKLVNGAGLNKVKDTWAYKLDISKPILPETIQKLVSRAVDRGQVTFRPINMDKYEEELKIILDIFNDAWKNNWNFIPFTPEEFNLIGKEILLAAPKNFIQIAEVDGEDAAFIVLVLFPHTHQGYPG